MGGECERTYVLETLGLNYLTGAEAHVHWLDAYVFAMSLNKWLAKSVAADPTTCIYNSAWAEKTCTLGL